MNIGKKIEKIRKQPYHVRMQWVWGCVAVSMFFIVSLWIFSIASMFVGIKKDSSHATDTDAYINNLKEQMQVLPDQVSSIKNFDSQSIEKELEKDSFSSQEKEPSWTSATDLESSTVSKNPESDSYSSLPKENSNQ